MPSGHRLIRLALAASLVVTSEFVALAQQQQARAGYKPVFGGAAADPNETQSVDLSMTVAEAYDQNLMGDLGGIAPSAFQVSGAYTSLVPQLDVALRNDRVQFSATAGTNERYYGQLHKSISMGHNAAVGMSTKIGRSTRLLWNEGASYAPAYLYGLFQTSSAPVIGATGAGPADYQTNSERSYSSATTVGLTHDFSDRASLELTANYHYSGFTGHTPGLFNLTSYDGGGRWTYVLSRNARLRLGYTYRKSQFAPSLRPVEHDIDLGVDYTRPLSATRRAIVGFSMGPTIITGPLLVGDAAASNHYRLIGDAFVERQLGRTWHARAAYHRGIAYIQGIAAPVYNDAASVESGGFLSRRVDLFFSAAYALGQMAARSVPGQYTSYSGDARLRIGLTRDLAFFIEGLAYDYNFDKSLLLLPGLPSHFTRNSARAGLTLWLPVRSR